MKTEETASPETSTRRAARPRIKPGTPWAALPARYREVVAMREQGESYADIGRHLGVSRQRAYQMAMRADKAMHGAESPPEQ